MKKYLVIGNPINHSLSPKIHNFWIKKNKIKAVYEKRLLKIEDIEGVISEMRNEKIDGINITVPFKKTVMHLVDELSSTASEAQSVNTLYKKGKNIIGDNTDVVGFEEGIKYCNYSIKGKKIFILGAGGVVSSIIVALKKMGVSRIYLSNRTEDRALKLKKSFTDIELVPWGKLPNFDMILNATSIGLEKNEEIKIEFKDISPSKFFYDVIYNPIQTNFLKKAKGYNHRIENGKMMFIYQAAAAFKIWHGIVPEINNEILNLLEND